MSSQEEQIFIFTAGDQEARAHLDTSIRNPLDLDQVLDLFPEGDHDKIRSIHAKHGLYAWGAIPGKQNSPRWNAMKPGDWVLCVFEKKYHYVCQVVEKFQNEKFSHTIWGKHPSGDTWSLMYFLSRPVQISVSLDKLADVLNKSYMGFFRIGDRKVVEIVNAYGSVEAFIQQRLLNSEMLSTPHPLDLITREDVLDALQKIDQGDMFGFGASNDYDLLQDEKRYPPKAAAGIATIRTLGRPMRPDEFSAGIGSKNFRVLQKLGFEIVPKLSEDFYLVIRSNPDSPYQDDLGKKYHFSSNVPNHKKLLSGAHVIVDSKTSTGVKLLGYGKLAAGKQVGTQGKVLQFEALFLTWNEMPSPKDFLPELLTKIQEQPGYNVQHAIRPISKEVYEFIVDTISESPVEHRPLCLLGTAKDFKEISETAKQLIDDQGGYASWWSFVLKPKALEHFQYPFYMYLNKGRGKIAFRYKVEDVKSVEGSDGIESPWPSITPMEFRGKAKIGSKQSEVFKTWLKVSAIESLNPELDISDFEPADPWSNEKNILNQNAFGYAYRRELDIAKISSSYSIEDALHDLFMEEANFRKILNLFETKQNIILQGAPGTGKTFIAKRLAYALMGEKDTERLKMVQFHQSYAYEDFMGGYRPVENDSGSGFAFRKGIFYRFCDEAKKYPGKKYVFVIDEINRGNLSKIFGEVMMLVESDKRGPDWGIPLTYSKEKESFYIPENVYILGLMNTADRSLAMVDYALRRRFAFWSLRPAYGSEQLAGYLKSYGLSADIVSKIFNRMDELNNEIEADRDLGRGFLIGHSFFCRPNLQDGEYAWYHMVIESEIEPLLREYWFDKTEKEIKSRVDQLLI